MKKLILASKSPRRIELIQNLGVSFEIMSKETDEVFDPSLTPQQNVMHTALQKAEAVYADLIDKTDLLVLGVDTIVLLEDKILTKPRDRADALRIIRMLSGKKHIVLSGVAMITEDKTHCFYEQTSVEFMPLSDKEIEDYLDTTEPYDKAGAYGIQGTASLFISGIQGCYYNIMGLPLNNIYCNLRDLFNFDFIWK